MEGALFAKPSRPNLGPLQRLCLGAALDLKAGFLLLCHGMHSEVQTKYDRLNTAAHTCNNFHDFLFDVRHQFQNMNEVP